ncbi:protein kinase domain-containing protein [Pendulispora albinea]|uniref:non-specific serine/threonine protein kinase n=1 Tax=Pendulispora albinea TaxID=2741071 RepID=A0ABZ2LNM7_9BACT
MAAPRGKKEALNFPRPFGPYTLLARVNSGGMAEVFRARQNEHGYFVALKKILPDIAEDEQFISMFEDEARIVSRLEHPHIARMLDFGRVDESYYIAFEYVHGKDLRAVFERSIQKRTPIPLPFVLYAFTRIGEGLSYAHARRDEKGLPVSIVHRDISPQNIVVSSDGDIKLIDFGIAKAKGKASQTAVGSIKGSFGYMSPEQVSGAAVDAQTDVFAMGICLWELLTQRRLFDGDNEFVILQKIRGAAQLVAPPSRYRADIPPALDRVVLRALATDLALRYRSAKELYRELHAVAIATGALASRVEMATYMLQLFPELSAAPQASESGRPSGTSRTSGALSTSRISSTSSMSRRASKNDRNTSDGERIGWQDAPARDEPARNPLARDRRFDAGQVSGNMSARAEQSPALQESTTMSEDDGGNQLRREPHELEARRKEEREAEKKEMGEQDEDEADTINGPLPLKPPPPEKPPLPAKPRTAMLRDKLRASHPPPVANPVAVTSGAPRPPDPPPAPPRPNPHATMQSLGGGGRPVRQQTIPGVHAPPIPGDISSSDLTPVAVPFSAATPVTYPAAAYAAQAYPSQHALQAVPGPSAKPLPVDWDDEHEASNVLDHDDGPRPRPRLGAPPPPEPPPVQAPISLGGAPPISGYRPQQASIEPFPPSSGPKPVAATSGYLTQPSRRYGSAPPASSRQPAALAIPMSVPIVPPATANHGASHLPSHAPAAALPQPNRNEATALVRPPPGRWGLIVGLGLALVIVMAMALLIVFFPRAGKVAIRVTDAKGANYDRVEIFVDGRKHCDTSPCLVEGVSTGAHLVKAIAEGGAVSERSILAEARKQTPVDIAFANVARAVTGLKLAASQPGMKLYVDGREIGLLPQEVKELVPGDHKVRIVGSERYEPLERTVTVTKDEMHDLGTLSLKVLRGKVTITLGTPGAKVYLVSGLDRRDLPTFPISVDIDASNTTKAWVLEASRAGFSEYKQPISFADGKAEKSYHILLEPKSVAAPAAPAPRPAAPASVPTSVPVLGGSKAEAPVAEPAGEAFLNINSIPASSVVLDGKPIGSTPKVRYSVPPGNHTVVFVNTEQGLRKSVQVTVASGDTKPVIGKLRE